EGMTKFFRVPILVDDAVAEHVRANRAAGWARVRRLAKVRPAGMRAAVLVKELLPPVGPGSLPGPKLPGYAGALVPFLARRWQDTRNLLRFLTNDGPSEFLMNFMQYHPDGPPDDWDGAIPLEKK